MEALGIFRSNIQRILEKLNWSQADLAKKTGIAQPSINVYLSGKKDPNVETCEKIAKVLGVPLHRLFDDKKQIEGTPPHSLQDCLNALAKSASKDGMNFEVSFSKALPQPKFLSEEVINYLYGLNDDERDQKLELFSELLSVLAPLDNPQIASALRHAHMLKRTGASSSVRTAIEARKKKIE